jgi:glycosyltransferase involved in cell wall biosynthesis
VNRRHSKQKVLHLLNLRSRCVRTMEEFVCTYRDAVQDNYEVVAIFTGGAESAVKQALAERGVTVVDGASLATVLRLVMEARVRVLHLHFVSPLNRFMLLRPLGVNLYYTDHTSDTGYSTGPLKRVKNYLFSSFYSGIFPVSEYVAQRLRELGFRQDRIHVAHNGINLGRLLRRQPRPRPPGPPVIGYLGQIMRDKGSHLLPEIVERVSRAVPGVRFELAGDGDLRDEVVGQLRERGIDFVFHGFLTEPAPVLERWHVCLGPSVWNEAFGLVFLEALALGVPVVAFDVGGIGEVVKHEHVGLLAPREDAAALADQVVRLLTDDVLYQRLTANAAAWVEQFALEQQVRKIVAWLPLPVADDGRLTRWLAGALSRG